MAEGHLIGSMNLDNAEQVFRTVAEAGGDAFKRIPDGETGPRRGWIFHQVPRLEANPSLEHGPGIATRYIPMPGFKLRDGVDPESVEFDLGFGTTAVEAYPTFRALKDEGVIAPDVEFLIAIPTQAAIFGNFISPESQPQLVDVYERQLAAEVAKVADAVPHDELAIQWDVAMEFAVIEGVIDSPLYDTAGLLDQVARMAAMVPDDVTLGFHLCYGDAPIGEGGIGQHFIQPSDAGNLMTVANGISQRVGRDIAFLQMPVPISRDDDAYFEPLADLRMAETTKLFLGLLHHQDLREGAERRIATAARHVTGFGVACECGMANKPRAAIEPLLSLHQEIEVPA
jgi:hypothetical protein